MIIFSMKWHRKRYVFSYQEGGVHPI
eukprot:COSAG06_NODE_4444_length_4257_cov_2.427609_1_plen_25_part_10